ncbi:MAG TPA: hypothetical protein VKB87_13510, partial [Myxococcaceae bacterium]|nr:hypothetical protein [Myxococcaceae bacterium]
MATKQKRITSVASGGVIILAIVSLAVTSKCSDRSASVGTSKSASSQCGPPPAHGVPASQDPLLPTDIPMFA